MDILAKYNNLDDFKKKGARTERQELVGRIATFTNPSRKQSGYRPYTYAKINELTAHLNIFDLRNHVTQAEKKGNASRYFWGLLKAK
jgi:hypothetical protein